MKGKHLLARLIQCRALAQCSPCPRAKFGAVILDPVRNTVLSDGYNGSPRGATHTLCGTAGCLRDQQKIPSGTSTEVGCIHAEANAICNAAATGTSLAGAVILITGEPCLACSKLIHHSGIVKAYIVAGGYTSDAGCDYLRTYGVEVEYVEGVDS